MSKDITPDEESKEDFQEDTPKDTPTKGNVEKDEDTEVSNEAFLKKINEIEGRDYKTIEAYQKTVKERQKAFAENGQAKVVADKKAIDNNGSNEVIKSLYFNANPEAKLIWDTVEKEAKNLGKDPFELYESSAYLKGEAQALAEDGKNETKVSSPSGKIKEKETLTEEEEMEKKFNRNLPPGFK